MPSWSQNCIINSPQTFSFSILNHLIFFTTMKLTLLFAAAAIAAPAKDLFERADEYEGIDVKYTYDKDGQVFFVVDEKDYGWNNNCYVSEWGKPWSTKDGDVKKDAWVVCLKAERRLARDVRKLSETNCVKDEVSSKSCTVEDSNTETFEEGANFGVSGEGFSAGFEFKFSQSKTHKNSQSFEQKCTGNQLKICHVGGPAYIEYDFYAGWVHWNSWRYPDSESGPQWEDAGDWYGGMWDRDELHQKYNADAQLDSGWWSWKAAGDACDRFSSDYNTPCSVAKNE
ncbi:hypothetical protein DICA3_C10066 [Diutina catenulata]